MEMISAEDVDLDTERIGANVVCSLHNSSPENQRTVDYIHKLHEMRKKQERLEQIRKRKVELEETERKKIERKKMRLLERKLKKKKED